MINLLFAGSVDDGKSTLIGRMLVDSDRVKKDVLETIRRDSEMRGEELDYSLITDGLTSEKNQRITIDIAHLYIDLDGERIHILDCPGHQEYTRNMAVAASTADIAVVLMDVTKGITEQTSTHLEILKKMGVEDVVIACNKMDLVGYKMDGIGKELRGYTCVPISAKTGWNVLKRAGGQEVSLAEEIRKRIKKKKGKKEGTPIVFDVFSVIFNDGKRGYTGRLRSGELKKGEKLKVLRTGEEVLVSSYTQTGDRAILYLHGERDIDIGDTLAAPSCKCNVKAYVTLFWFCKSPLQDGRYIAQGCEYGRKRVHILETAHEHLLANDVTRALCEFDTPVLSTPHVPNHYLLIHPTTYETVGCVLIRS